MLRHSLLLLLSIFLVVAPANSRAAILTNLFNTGLRPHGPLLASQADTHWQIISGSGANTTATNAWDVYREEWPGSWMAQTVFSQWIGPSLHATNPPAASEFRYRTSFDLTGYNCSKVVLLLRAAADDGIAAVLLNDQVTGLSFTNGPSAWETKQLIGGFQNGTNTLDFVVTNSGGPTAFRCELSGTDTAAFLQVQRDGDNLLVNWSPDSDCYLLESTTNLSDSAWVTNTSAPVLTNGTLQTTYPAEPTLRYFRLRRPPAPLPLPTVVVNPQWAEVDPDSVQVAQFSPESSCPAGGCSINALGADTANIFDASAMIEMAGCSTNDPAIRFKWEIRYPADTQNGVVYTSARIPSRSLPVLTLPPNALPSVLGSGLWRAYLTFSSQVDPAVSRTVMFSFRYVGSELTLGEVTD